MLEKATYSTKFSVVCAFSLKYLILQHRFLSPYKDSTRQDDFRPIDKRKGGILEAYDMTKMRLAKPRKISMP